MKFWFNNAFIFIFAVYLVILYSLYYIKKRRTKNVHSKAIKSDAIWLESNIQDYIEDLFYEVYESYQMQSTQIINRKITDKFRQQFKTKFIQHKKGLMSFFIDDFEFEACKIVEVKDYQNDDKDTLAVLVLGMKREYLQFEPENQIVEGEDQITEFRSIWRFTRLDNTWMLDEIEPDVSIKSLKAMNSLHQ